MTGENSQQHLESLSLAPGSPFCCCCSAGDRVLFQPSNLWRWAQARGHWLGLCSTDNEKSSGGRRAENHSNKEKKPPETQSEYFSCVSAAVWEDSVKARFFCAATCYLKNREQEEEAECSDWFIWMRCWLFYGHRISDWQGDRCFWHVLGVVPGAHRFSSVWMQRDSFHMSQREKKWEAVSAFAFSMALFAVVCRFWVRFKVLIQTSIGSVMDGHFWLY